MKISKFEIFARSAKIAKFAILQKLQKGLTRTLCKIAIFAKLQFYLTARLRQNRCIADFASASEVSGTRRAWYSDQARLPLGSPAARRRAAQPAAFSSGGPSQRDWRDFPPPGAISDLIVGHCGK